jgi:hypothetical protein
MRGRIPILRCLAACVLALALSGPLAAASVGASTPATGKTLLLFPLSVEKVEDLDFGYLAVTSAGTAVINPDTNVMTTTGGVVALGGSRHAALFAGSSNRSSVVVNIKIPNQPITLTRVGGTQTMTVSNFTLQGQSKRTIAAQSSFTFRVGGTLNVAAGQAEGVYTGTFDVTVQYP